MSTEPGGPLVVERGYCRQCHAVTEARDGRCSVCGAELIDVNVESRPLPPTMPPPPPVAPPDQPAAPRSHSIARRLAWTFAVLLLLVGLGGFVIANHDDNLNKKTFAADYKALGKRNADTTAKALDFRVRKVNAAYNAYVAAELTVRTRHEAVTNQFNEVVSPLDPLLLVDIANARQHLPQVIAKYGAALKQERATRQAYVHQLALLKAQVAK